ncbi:hypothetical protein NIIg32_gp34 [Parageobacillus phage vB_PtoS_NIIg3.2]|nr:hypothetical protein NIIg32_gp34 [Parageobacillus phage vB_PtoS_NIIg3.2]
MMNLREINWFVAEKVMNWHVWENEDGELMVTKGYGCYSHCPSFSTNIADAWPIVEKLKIAVIPQAGEPPKNMKYLAEIDRRPLGGYYEAFAETAPLAICLAALKSVGIEVEVTEQ